MFWFGCCSRLFEPVRDVSFITNYSEKILIQDFINACDTAGAWAQIRSGKISNRTASEIEAELVYEHDFDLMLQIMNHMATDWEEWVINRKLVQEKEESNRVAIAEWVSKYKWNTNANDVLLLAYMENLLTLAKKLEAEDLIEKILFQLEVSLARKAAEDMESYKNFLEHVKGDHALEEYKESMEYKLEICKIVTAIHLPSTYRLTKERWDKNKEYIESCETMKKILGDLQQATITKNVGDLRKALEFSESSPSLRNTAIYMEAEALASSVINADPTEVAI